MIKLKSTDIVYKKPELKIWNKVLRANEQSVMHQVVAALFDEATQCYQIRDTVFCPINIDL